jgi:hypothetical protein
MLSLEEVRKLIADALWDSLIGQTEGDFFDCKRVVYRLEDDRQCQELAKDVSSFANVSGGFILLGFDTKPSVTHPADEVTSLRPFDVKYLNIEQYYALLRDWVLPEIDGLNVRWVPRTAGSTEGFGIIEVPPQKETRKPFVLVRTVQEDGRRRGLLVGYVQRKRDVSQPAAPHEVAQWLRDGRNYQSRVETELADIKAALERIVPGGGAPGGTAADESIDPATVEVRINDASGVTGLVNRPHYVLAAWPTPTSEPRSILQTGPGTITGRLENPPVLRYAGWSLETLDHAAGIIEGKYRQVTNGDRKVLRLYRDGMLLHAVSAGADFLGWGNPDQYRQDPRIISLAIIEVTLLFCRFYAEVLKDLPKPPRTLTFAIRLGKMASATEKPVRLSPFQVSTGFDLFDRGQYPAPFDSYSHEIRVQAEGFDPAAAAYQIVQEIYLWFRVEATSIPYTELVSGAHVISETKIRGSK